MNKLYDFENKIKTKIQSGEASVGCFLLSANSFIAEAMANHPIDWMVIDMEASHSSKEDALHILQAINAYDVVPIIRVSEQNKHAIESSLDFGARGIMIPKVDTPEQAAEMARSCYYPPKGNRGVNCIRASAYYTRARQYLEQANDSILSLIQIESKESVENILGIAAVPEVDVLFVGPGDLAASYGQTGVVTGRLMDAARRRVVDACQELGKIAGIFAHDIGSANQYIKEGFKFVAIGNDVKYLSLGLTLSLGKINRRGGAVAAGAPAESPFGKPPANPGQNAGSPAGSPPGVLPVAGASPATATKAGEPQAFEGRPPSYSSPGLHVWYHTVDFVEDAKFMAAYRLGMEGASEFLRRVGAGPDVHHEWPVLVCCWAAWHAKHLTGDFVECGTNTGLLSMAVCSYLDFNLLDKSFYLFDTYCGIPTEQMSDTEKSLGRDVLSRTVYRDCYEATKRSFAPYPRVELVRGKVPDTLPTVNIDRVCYLSIDMNIVFPELAALEYFWEKLSPGAPVILDDYGKAKFAEQKRAMDEFSFRRGVKILNLPTGQGLLLKP